LTRTQPNDAEIYAGRYKLILAASNSGFWWSRLTFVELRNPLLDDERRRRRERERERERYWRSTVETVQSMLLWRPSVAYYSPDLPHASVHVPVSATSKQTLPSPSANIMLPA